MHCFWQPQLRTFVQGDDWENSPFTERTKTQNRVLWDHNVFMGTVCAIPCTSCDVYGGGGLNGWQVEGGDKRKDGECRGRGEGVQGKQAIKEGPEDFILISANPGLLNYMSVLKLTKINCVNQQGFTSVFHPQHRILQKDFRCFFLFHIGPCNL